MREPTVGSLFAGAGGFDMGFHQAGFRCAWQVEIDRTARAVLARHWPDVPRFEDIRECGARNLSPVDVLVGGFPCQDLSTAGKRLGFDGAKRSSLWFEMARIIRELQPAYVVWENVPGLLSSASGRDFLSVLMALDECGFAGGWRTLDAQFFGVPQQRRRVFGVFARGDLGAERCAEILALFQSSKRHPSTRRKPGKTTATTLTAGAGGGRRVATTARLLSPPCKVQASGGHRIGADAAASGQLVFGLSTSGERGADAALTAHGRRQDFDTENFVLIQDARAMDTKGQGGLGVRVSSVSYTLDTRVAQAVCVTGERTHSLTSEGADAGEDGTGRGTPIVFNWQSGGDCRINPSDLPDAQSVGQTPAVLHYSADYNQDRVYGTDGLTPALTATDSNRTRNQMVAGTVRRLTPRECERLMGWPDDWTRFRADGSEIADGPRYRMCGNGVVGTLSRWLASRLIVVWLREVPRER